MLIQQCCNSIHMACIIQYHIINSSLEASIYRNGKTEYNQLIRYEKLNLPTTNRSMVTTPQTI